MLAKVHQVGETCGSMTARCAAFHLQHGCGDLLRPQEDAPVVHEHDARDTEGLRQSLSVPARRRGAAAKHHSRASTLGPECGMACNGSASEVHQMQHLSCKYGEVDIWKTAAG